MEHMILLITILMIGAITFVLITHRRQCRINRETVQLLESAHWSTSVSSDGQDQAA
jgi:hypothetical protein